MNQMPLKFFIAPLILAYAVTAAGANTTPSVKKLKSERDQLSAQIEKLNSSHLTCRSDSDCAALEMGRKPCGGTWKFLVVSLRNPKLGEIKKKLASYAKADDAYNKAAELMSDCSIVMAPEVACVEKKCRTKAPSKDAGAEDLKPQ